MRNVNQLYNLKIDSNRMERILKAPEFYGEEDKVQSLEAYIKPLVYWKNIKINLNNRQGVSAGEDGKNDFLIQSIYVSEGLKDCHQITLLAATIGSKLSEYGETSYKEGKFQESIMADHLGSYAVEAVVEQFYQYLKQSNLLRGLYASPRFSPGYGDWNLSSQKELLSILQTEPCICANESYILQPIKSVTAIIGWSVHFLKEDYPIGEKTKGLCQGNTSCFYCRTWACKKRRV